jgi:hypothetical protein
MYWKAKKESQDKDSEQMGEIKCCGVERLHERTGQ